jgi:ornithine decarboxylase
MKLPARCLEIKKRFAGEKTPFLAVDLSDIRRKYTELTENFPEARVYYAVKANPDTRIIKLLASLGASFDIASIPELRKVLKIGISPQLISYGNTIKKYIDIDTAFKLGVRLFACDSENDLKNIAAYAPGSRVFFRLATDGSGSDWPLSKKFGAHPDLIVSMLQLARRLNIKPCGLSFHVGSQQKDIGQWDSAITAAKLLFDTAAKRKIQLSLLNLGGGLPCRYRDLVLELNVYCSEIRRYLSEKFGEQLPEIILEPGRALVGEAGTLVTEVISTSRKSKLDLYRWVYLDVGLFGGLIETLGEAIKYPLYCERRGRSEEVILAGPTCDSMDIMYQDHRYSLPRGLKEGERLYLCSTGAYTSSYSAVDFNGFPPLRTLTYEGTARHPEKSS